MNMAILKFATFGLPYFGNDDGNAKKNVTWKQTFARLWLFYKGPILFELHAQC